MSGDEEEHTNLVLAALAALGGSGGKFAREIQVGLELEEEGFVKVCGICDICLLK